MKFPGLCGPFYTSFSPNSQCEEAINLYLERVESGQGKNAFAMCKTPGLLEFFASGVNGPVRGMLNLNDHLFAMIGGTIFHLDANANIIDSTAGLADDGLPVTMAANTDQLVIVSANVAYVAQLGTIVPITWFGPGVSIAAVGFINQYFLFLDADGSGFYYSEPGDAAAGDPLNFVSAEASANKYISLLVDDPNIWLFGNKISQIFYDNSANDPDNPFLPNLSAVIPHGTAARFSPVSFDTPIWIGRGQYGQGVAYIAQGYEAVRISTHAVENAWRKYATIADAVGMVCSWNGHDVVRFWFPSADETWQYDMSLPPSLGWSKVLYWDQPYGVYRAHRGSCACVEFGKVLVGDRSNGKIYSMSPDYLSDDGEVIRWLRRAPIISNQNKRTSFPWIELDMQVGVGDGSNGDPLLGTVTPEYDPQVSLRISQNWGQTWGGERMRSMGRLGEYSKRVIWMRNGIGRQTVLEFSGTASVKTVINNCYLRDPIGRET